MALVLELAAAPDERAKLQHPACLVGTHGIPSHSLVEADVGGDRRIRDLSIWRVIVSMVPDHPFIGSRIRPRQFYFQRLSGAGLRRLERRERTTPFDPDPICD